MRRSFLLLTLAIASLPAHAGDTASTGPDQILAPFVDDLTFVVGRVDVSRLDLDVLARQVQAIVGERGVAEGKAVAELLKATFVQSGGKEIYALKNWADPLDDILVIVPLAPKANGPAIATMVGQLPGFKTQVKDRLVLAGPPRLLDKLKDFQAKPVPALAKAFTGAGDAPVQAILLPPAPLRRALLEMFPTLPKDVGGGPTARVMLEWATAEINVKPLQAKVTIKVKDAEAADRLLELIDRLLFVLALDDQVKAHHPHFPKVVPILTPKAQADRLVLTLTEKEIHAVVAPLLGKQGPGKGQRNCRDY